jgi:hypothetical protein
MIVTIIRSTIIMIAILAIAAPIMTQGHAWGRMKIAVELVYAA